jgi:hypothetical protein
MTEEDEEFNRIEREAAMRMEAVAATVQKPMHPEIKKMYEDYFDRCFRESAAIERQWTGLTDAELVEFSSAELGPYDLCLEVEAKLREKNT